MLECGCGRRWFSCSTDSHVVGTDVHRNHVVVDSHAVQRGEVGCDVPLALLFVVLQEAVVLKKKKT